MGENLLQIQNVHRDFYRHSEVIRAVNGVNLDIEKGTFNILCGRSGSGKTTLLNMLAAIDTPTSGKIIFDGRDISSFKESERDALRRKDIGIIFQNTALIAHMTALESVEFSLSIAGVKPKFRRQLAVQWLDRMGIRERRNHMPAEMSGGEQARVAISRAVVFSPKLLLADEPTAQLDSKTSFKVMDLFRELVETQGMTIIMTTHDVNIMDEADRIFTLEDGVIVGEREGTRGRKKA